MNRTRASAAVALVAALAVAGCGGSAAAAATPSAHEPAAPFIQVAAKDVAFDRAELRAPANRPFTLVFENRDALAHNVSIYSSKAGQTGQERVFEGAVFTGPATRWYAVPSLPPGDYAFICDVHNSIMTGRLVVS